MLIFSGLLFGFFKEYICIYTEREREGESEQEREKGRER